VTKHRVRNLGERIDRSDKRQRAKRGAARGTRQLGLVNESLDATPELVNTDPYGEGWMYELRPSDAAAVDALLDPAAYQAQLG